jgi:hypothetical protein
MELVEQLFRDYNDYRLQTNHIYQAQKQNKYIRTLKWTSERQAVFQSLVEWCGQQQIDSRFWLWSLFHARRWLFAPPLNQLIPSKKKKQTALERYHALQGDISFSHRIQNEVHQQKVIEGSVFDRNRDLSAFAEKLKQRYAVDGNFERCLAEMDSQTFGFHPKSSVCSSCPVQQMCGSLLQSKVSFDIMALRRGEITLQQAQMMSGHSGCGN